MLAAFDQHALHVPGPLLGAEREGHREKAVNDRLAGSAVVGCGPRREPDFEFGQDADAHQTGAYLGDHDLCHLHPVEARQR